MRVYWFFVFALTLLPIISGGGVLGRAVSRARKQFCVETKVESNRPDKMRGKSSSKRAHRKIDLGEAEYTDRQRKDSRLGGLTDAVPDDTIFFLDNGGGYAASSSTPKEKVRSRMLRVDALLSKPQTMHPFPVPLPRKCRASSSSKNSSRSSKTSSKVRRVESVSEFSDEAVKLSHKSKQRRMFTLDGLVNSFADASKVAAPRDLWGGQVKPMRKLPESNMVVFAAASTSAETLQPRMRQLRNTSGQIDTFNRSCLANVGIAQVSAVHIDAAGSSYNPPEDARQEVIAKEVGGEISDMLKIQYNPVRAPFPGRTKELSLTEELHYAQGDSEEEGMNANEGLQSRTKNPAVTRDGKMSKAQKNKRQRRNDQEAKDAANKRTKRQRRDISSLKDLDLQINEEEEAQQARLARRKVTRMERASEVPCRLGKHLYRSEPAPVLLTEELTGNLRTVSGTHTLIRDRLKSLQRRALVEPRRKVEKVKSKSYIKYQPGSKGEKESDMHRETLKAGAN